MLVAVWRGMGMCVIPRPAFYKLAKRRKNFGKRLWETPIEIPLGLTVDDGIINGQVYGRLRGPLQPAFLKK